MSTPILVVDMGRVLDECPAGRAASVTLQQRYTASKAAFEKLRGKADGAGSSAGRARAEEAAAQFQEQAIAEIEAERARLGQAAVATILPVLEAVRSERGAGIVVDTRTTLAAAAGLDITDEVLRRLD